MNRKRTLFYAAIVFATAFLSVCLNPNRAYAGFLYFSVNEQTPDGDPVWFTPGYYGGSVHSNDYFRFNLPGNTIIGFLSTSKDSIIFGNGMTLQDLNLEREPLFGQPEYHLENANYLRAGAQEWIDSRDGRMMTRLRMRGERGIQVHQYVLGTPPQDSLIKIIRPMNFGGIFVDGQVEIEGEVVGKMTIGSSGDMYLIGDILYDGADYYNGQFPEDAMSHMLGLLSEGDIIIRNNEDNGRDNGWADGAQPNQIDHHSIVIDAALVALGGTFKFENANEDWEMHQGPEPDERGIIHLKGAIAQRYAFPMHNDNNGGTGYYIDYKYDERFVERTPPFIEGVGGTLISGNLIRYIRLGVGIVVDDAECILLSAGYDAQLKYRGSYRLTVIGRLYMNGSPQHPIGISYEAYADSLPPATLSCDFGGYYPTVRLSNVNVETGVTLKFLADSILIDSCSFADNVYLQASYVSVRNSVFKDTITLAAWDFGTFERNVVQGMLVVDRRPRIDTIRHNTIVNPGGDGVLFENYDRVEFRNNIVAFCQRGVVNAHWQEPTLEYNDVYGNGEDYVDCQPGEGSISADPRLVNPDSGDFHLEWNSPCIDAGDPDSPEDPDGTRADIGAFYFDALSEPSSFIPHPSSFTLSISPNPFNHQATIRYRTPKTAEVEVMIFNLRGERVAEIFKGLLIAGQYSAVWDASNQPAGVYLCRILAGGRCGVVKVVLLK